MNSVQEQHVVLNEILLAAVQKYGADLALGSVLSVFTGSIVKGLYEDALAEGGTKEEALTQAKSLLATVQKVVLSDLSGTDDTDTNEQGELWPNSTSK